MHKMMHEKHKRVEQMRADQVKAMTPLPAYMTTLESAAAIAAAAPQQLARCFCMRQH